MKMLKTFKYAGYVIFHPFDGFWDLKNEKRGSLTAALVFLAMTVITFVLKQRYTGFVYNTNSIVKMNVLIEIFGVLPAARAHTSPPCPGIRRS